MLKLESITDNPKQRQSIVLSDGSIMLLRLEFKPQQNGWFITELTLGDFTLMGQRITTSPNILNQYHKLINFGIACFVDGGGEPQFIEDFSTGRAELFLLSEEEVIEFNDYLSTNGQ